MHNNLYPNNSIPNPTLAPSVAFKPVNNNFLEQSPFKLSIQEEPQEKLKLTDITNASTLMPNGNLTQYQVPSPGITCMSSAPNYCQSVEPINSDVNLEVQRALIDVQAYGSKKLIEADCNLYIDDIKQKRRAQAQERKFSNFHRIIISITGEIRVENNVSRGTSVICNLKKPRLCEMYHSSNCADIIYRLDGEIDGKTICIYLDANEAGNVNYLHKKFVKHGILLFNDKLQVRKNYAEQIFSTLKCTCKERFEVYDVSGWNSDCNGNLKFVKEGELLWATLKTKTH